MHGYVKFVASVEQKLILFLVMISQVKWERRKQAAMEITLVKRTIITFYLYLFGGHDRTWLEITAYTYYTSFPSSISTEIGLMVHIELCFWWA